eukprot:4129744-Prymnesium_polylepis.1
MATHLTTLEGVKGVKHPHGWSYCCYCCPHHPRGDPRCKGLVRRQRATTKRGYTRRLTSPDAPSLRWMSLKAAALRAWTSAGARDVSEEVVVEKTKGTMVGSS